MIAFVDNTVVVEKAAEHEIGNSELTISRRLLPHPRPPRQTPQRSPLTSILTQSEKWQVHSLSEEKPSR